MLHTKSVPSTHSLTWLKSYYKIRTRLLGTDTNAIIEYVTLCNVIMHRESPPRTKLQISKVQITWFGVSAGGTVPAPVTWANLIHDIGTHKASSLRKKGDTSAHLRSHTAGGSSQYFLCD